MTSTWPLLWLLAQAAAPPAAGAPPPPAGEPPPAPTTPPAAPPPAAARPAPPPHRPPPPPPPVLTPFRLSLNYVHILREDGELATKDMTTNAVGIDMAFPSNTYVRNHLGLAHQWESAPGYSARGFRIDLISLGYPIPIVTSQTSTFHLDLEPILTVVRGEIMFVNGGGRLLRVESGFSLELSVAVRRWFIALQALAIDFRYWVYTSTQSLTGFSRVIPLRAAIGHEF